MTETIPPAEGTGQTPAPTEETTEEKYSKQQLTDLITKEIGKVTAKHSKKIEALQAELEAERRKALPDPEKVKAELADKEKLIQEATNKLLAYESKEKKRAALDAAKLSLPENITYDHLLKLMPGNSDEEIAEYIEIFKMSYPKSQSLGTSTTTGGASAKPKTVIEQIADIQDKINDPKTTSHEKLTFGRQLVSLNNELMRGI